VRLVGLFSVFAFNSGLGTSSAQEAKEYFSDMARHRIKFNYKGEEDDFSITMVSKKKCQ